MTSEYASLREGESGGGGICMYVCIVCLHTCVLLKEGSGSFYILQKNTPRNVACLQRSGIQLHRVRPLFCNHIIIIPVSPVYASVMLFSLSLLIIGSDCGVASIHMMFIQSSVKTCHLIPKFADTHCVLVSLMSLGK